MGKEQEVLPQKTGGFPQDQSPANSFLALALRDLNKPYLELINNPQGLRRLLIAFDYLDSPDTQEEVGKKYGVTKKRINQIVGNVLYTLWHNSSPGLKSQFPLDVIKSQKPRSIEMRKTASIRRTGLLVEIAELLTQKPPLSYDQIKTQTGLSPAKLAKVRQMLGSWGLTLPRINKPYKNIDTLTNQLRDAVTDDEIRALLSRVTRRFLEADRKMSKLLTPVKIATGNYFYALDQIHYFIESIRNAGIPLGIIEVPLKPGKPPQKYYFFASKHLDRAHKAFGRNPKIDRFKVNPVTLFCGNPPGKLPNSVDLKKHKTVITICSELKIDVRSKSRKLRITDLIDKTCRIPIYFYHRRYYYSSKDHDDLMVFIKQRYRELTSI